MHPILNVPDSLAAKIVIAAVCVVALILFIRNYMKNGGL
jgi:hypothetical protein